MESERKRTGFAALCHASPAPLWHQREVSFCDCCCGRYVKGDFRFSKGYSKGNPRKMVKVWAEKEMRNLMRVAAAGIRCPRVHQLQMHVLVMGFIGSGAVAAPRLKDADLPLVRLTSSAHTNTV